MCCICGIFCGIFSAGNIDTQVISHSCLSEHSLLIRHDFYGPSTQELELDYFRDVGERRQTRTISGTMDQAVNHDRKSRCQLTYPQRILICSWLQAVLKQRPTALPRLPTYTSSSFRQDRLGRNDPSRPCRSIADEMFSLPCVARCLDSNCPGWRLIYLISCVPQPSA